MSKTELEKFLAEEVEKTKGISYPVKAGVLRRLFVKKLPLSKLHPNPNDEFCFPDIGPNYEIISRYEKDFRRFGGDLDGSLVNNSASEPIDVEKISPHGYRILNGHHRWAAARALGMKKLRVKIVDLTQGKDIRKMIEAAGSDRRVTLDLDEVVFRPADHPYLEKELPYPLKRMYKERLRLGIPALFSMLNQKGYDIWVYTANNVSLDYLRHYFKHYRIHVAGIITGTGRKGPSGTDTKAELEKMMNEKYKSTVHIGDSVLVSTVSGSRDFVDYPLNENSPAWSREVMEAFEKIRKHE